MQSKITNQSAVKKNIIRCLEIQHDNEQNYYGCFQFGPLKSNQTITISNTLRRILLSNIPGVGITCIRFNNRFINEFSTLPNFRESVLEILINLSQIDFYPDIPFSQPQFIRFKPTKVGKIYAKDIPLPPFISISNPEQYIAEIVFEDEKFDCVLLIERGKGYSAKSEQLSRHRFKNRGGCVLPLNTRFSPVKRVNFRIEDHLNSFQDKNDYYKTERIIFEIWTKKSLHPIEALRLGMKEIVNIFTELQDYIPTPQNQSLGLTTTWVNVNIYKYLKLLSTKLEEKNVRMNFINTQIKVEDGIVNMPLKMVKKMSSLRIIKKKVPISLYFYEQFNTTLKTKIGYTHFTISEREYFSTKIFQSLKNSQLQLPTTLKTERIEIIEPISTKKTLIIEKNLVLQKKLKNPFLLLQDKKHLKLLLPTTIYDATYQAEISSFETLFKIPRKKLLRIKGLGGRKGIIEARLHMKTKLGYLLRSRKKKRETKVK